jgi:hypothetical protein
MAAGQQLADGPPADDSRGSGDHDLAHVELTA